ncbi:hypothetical protein [Hydrogenophaga sp. 2FB]|uniref:hypothetical protein n=1 Tax=Hydrogenophaga sp. 2FB TaxID=2502187 RepID=UPI0010F9485E|nr:hypothetical protein [Hydrogenophaga sp. 2FB]
MNDNTPPRHMQPDDISGKSNELIVVEATNAHGAGRSVQIEVLDADEGDDGVQRVERHDVLEPGCYWRVRAEFKIQDKRWSHHHVVFPVGDVHLLLSLNHFEDELHSIELLEHPRDGARDSYTILIHDFLDHFDPISDQEAEDVRRGEQNAIMANVSQMQEEMAQAQINPLALPEVREAAEKAVEDYEQAEVNRAQADSQSAEKRAQDIRRIHRRAGRRSAAKGNPLAVRKTTISDRLDVMISEGITSDGVRELSLEAGRRIAIAQAASTWLSKRAEHMGQYLKTLAPYYAEKPQVALAKSREAITLVKTLSEGIESLKLYTGDSVTVVTLATGAGAVTSEPLTLVQGKRFMDSELAVWAHVEDSFDWSSRPVFFEQLLKNKDLQDQLLPTQRCVVSMAVTEREVGYGEKMNPYERLMNKLENQRVFLLVRDGENIHVVYSQEPSHEAAPRLFPTRGDLKTPFNGLDGTEIGLKDVRFAKSSARFDDMALLYKRFLILLCGLDHREQLFGDFYPRELGLKFMSLDFQQQYFRFLEDDDSGRMIDSGKVVPVMDWIDERNSFLRSGSQIVVAPGASMRAVTAAISGRRRMRLDTGSLPSTFIATVSKGFHRIQVPYFDVDDTDHKVMATAWLDGPDHKKDEGSWFLCVDRVRLADVRYYLYSRRHRTSDLSWLRTLRRVEQVLEDDQKSQAELRAYLRKSALDAKVLTEVNADDAIDQAVATWRADRRGAPAPQLTEVKSVNEILTLMFPKGSLANTLEGMAQALAAKLNQVPLRFARNGKARFALYTEVPEQERQSYGTGIGWSWVYRHSVAEKRGALVSTSKALVWLNAAAQSAAEEVIVDWPELQPWLNECVEPVRPSDVAGFVAAMEAATSQGELLAASRTARHEGSSIDPDFFATMTNEWLQKVKKLTYYASGCIAIPVGMYQRRKDLPPVYVYMRVPVTQYVRRYGSAEQAAAFARLLHSSRACQEEARMSPTWRLFGMKKPINQTVFTMNALNDTRTLKWTQQEARRPGGLKRNELRSEYFHRTKKPTRRQRREEGGQPLLAHKSEVTVSFNRAFDNLMAVNPALKRAFYKSVEERVRRESPFGDDAKERRAEQRVARYVPNVPDFSMLSPLVWDAKRNRGLANRIFSSAT